MKTGFLIAVVMMVCVAAFGQSVYQLNYYSNRNNVLALDQSLRIINPGTQGTPLSPPTANGPGEGTICADVYVFDETQELSECCACVITANGLKEFSLLRHLTDNPLTGFPAPDAGVIAIVADNQDQCDATDPHPVPELLAWMSHVQQPAPGTFINTEDSFKVSLLTTGPDSELAFLGRACNFVHYLGTGKGVCRCGINAVG